MPPSSGQKYAIDSQITRAVRDLAPRFEHRLFLSATPHNGHSNSFSALLEILDPQRFCRGVPVKQKMLEDSWSGGSRTTSARWWADFRKREVVQIDIDGLPPDAPELRLSALLDQVPGFCASSDSRARPSEAGRGGPVDLRPPAAAPVVDRSLRSHAPGPPSHGPAPVGRGPAGKSTVPATAGQFDLLGGAVGTTTIGHPLRGGSSCRRRSPDLPPFRPPQPAH